MNKDQKQNGNEPLLLMICPITKGPMKDPVLASNGQIYKRVAIEGVFSESFGNVRSPVTGKPMNNRILLLVFVAVDKCHKILGE
mmetsp:Transcript_13556/g.31504  ORF Transcript_13556/g.31504 Transcript_13556/m.31504 type:complete len:84 (-) Transcript_13556:401-652(-)